MTEDSAAFEGVKEILSVHAETDPSRITMNTDLLMDLGIEGDDGDEVFQSLDKAFDVDWTNLDLGVHFGNEGFGPLLPWHLKNNCLMYEVQPCRVSDIVQAVETGRWPESPRVFRPQSEIARVYFWSCIYWLFIFGGLFGAMTLALFG